MQNLSLFDDLSPIEETFNVTAARQHLDVVKMDFVEAESLTWQELFDGFDTLYAITYSSGIGFVYQLLEKFSDAEIIFGCDEVISYSLQEIMAYQCKTIERMKDTASKMKLDLISRIEEGTLRFFVANSVLSHEKIYLLSSADGRKRVVMGSANMSFTAFAGGQRENICYMDSERAYDWYMACYNTLKECSTNQITKEAYLYADASENLENLPISKTVHTKKAVIIEPVDNADDVRFVLDVKNLAATLAPSVPKPEKKTGKILLSPEKIKSIRKQVVANQTKEKELRSEYPQLVVDVDAGNVSLNGKYMDLHPSEAEIRNDDALFLKYMAG